MTFKNYPCWKNNMVSQVMNTEALDMPDHLFLATHHPIKMYRIDLLNDEKGLEYDEESFLRDFMSTPDYNFITILGESGTGKSHLVRWLSANIPASPGRRVLLIRKARTNLKEIIRTILQNLDGPKFDDYRRRLIDNTDTISTEQARFKLLLSLIEVVGPYPERSEKITEEEEFIIQGLPDMLSDPFFQRKLLEDGGILHKLTIHIMGNSEKIERLEERRQFKLEDLPLNVRDIGKAGHHAKDFYSAIVADENLKKLTVDWINHNLDAAIAQVLAFRGQDLFNLMMEVRETLAEKDQELILLIEEFAKLQGIDTQLLEALLIRPNQGDSKLCNLRIALASTTGFFNKLPDTVKTRITFRVNLDVNKEGAEKIISNDDILEFTSRYLNAVRLEDSALRFWHSSGDVTIGQERDTLPCACQECAHMGPCHEAFGAAQGMGLYPFNDKAIHNMLRLVSPEQFNPRFYIDKALRHTLYNYRDSLASGQFPPIALLRHFGPASMGALQQAEIKRKDPKNHERRQALLELWGNPEIISDLHPVIHSSFDLPTLGVGPGKDVMPPTPPTETVPPKVEKPKSETIPDVLQNRVQKLDDWQNQSELNQDLAQHLREILFFAICSHIDWDSELLSKVQFVGVGIRKPFQQRGIIFQNQGTGTTGLRDVTLRIPLEGDSINEAALALQGALYFNHFKHWEFPKGPLYMRAYIRHLEKWSQYILEQVKKTVNEKDDWDPVSSVVEILAISSHMAGLPMSKLEDKIGSLFKNIPLSAGANRSAKWQNLYKKMASVRLPEEGSAKKGLNEILLARTACTKGGATPQMVDAGRYIKPLTDLAESCKPLSNVPNTLKASYSNISSAADDITKSLSGAIFDEVERCKNWLESVYSAFGQNPVEAEIVKDIRETIELATKEGVFGGSKDKLLLSLENFEKSSFTAVLNSTKRVIELQDEGTLLKFLGRLDDKAMSATDDFMQKADQFIIATTKRADDTIESWESKDNPDEISKKIQQHFEGLDSLLKAM